MLEQKVLTIDLGTSEVRVALSTVGTKERNFLVKKVPSRGIKGGNITNPSSAKDSLKQALSKLKIEAPSAVPLDAYVIVPGGYVLSYEVESKIVFPGMKTVSYNDVNAVKNKAKDELLKRLGQTIRMHYDVLHIIPQEFVVGNVDGIQNPIGHNGEELTMKAFVVLATKSYMATVSNLLKEVGLRLKGGVLQSLAAFYAIRDEKNYYNNNLFIYSGARNTEVLYFKEDKPILLRHLPFGTEDLLSHLIQKLKVGRKEAERLYLEYGSAYAFSVSKEEIVPVNLGSKVLKVPRLLIAALIHEKLKGLFKDIKEKLNSKDSALLSNLNRVYLCGGLAKLKDIELLAEKAFKAPIIVPEIKESGVDDITLAPILGVTRYVDSLMDRERLTDVREDLSKSHERNRGFFSGILRFILDLI
ncbi:MAG: cell division FtsA domain-containing protein [Desulfurobacteriaceae bacterium]